MTKRYKLQNREPGRVEKEGAGWFRKGSEGLGPCSLFFTVSSGWKEVVQQVLEV